MSPRILIIDDADHLRSVLKLTLEFKGYEVTDAGDGREALDAAHAQAFDLIFCDIEMPVMNGIEFVRHYRAEVSPATPIIMLTAEGNEPIGRALAAGATAVIHKPFEPISLLDEINRHLNECPG
jgi:CheY-like chemotaxis protein